VNVDNVRREDWILGGLGVLLIIVLVAFPWFSLGFGPINIDLTATDAPDGWLGVLAVIALAAAVADLAVERLSPQTQVPTIGGSRSSTRFILIAAAAGFMALKFLFHLGHFSDLGWGFWVGAIIAAALVYFAMQASNSIGGIGPRPSTTGAGTAPPSASTPPASSRPTTSTSPASTPADGGSDPAPSSAPPPSAPPPGP